VSPRSRSAAESDRGPGSRQGRGPEARRALEDVARTLRSIPGPNAWIQALFRLEAIARVAREAGDSELAERMAGQMLEHDPAYGGSHLALVAEHRGDAATAVEERLESALDGTVGRDRVKILAGYQRPLTCGAPATAPFRLSPAATPPPGRAARRATRARDTLPR
jgi:hypothetical protein